jgi:hypothetical protein
MRHRISQYNTVKIGHKTITTRERLNQSKFHRVFFEIDLT